MAATTTPVRNRERTRRRRGRRAAIVAAGLAAAAAMIGTFDVALAPSADAFCYIYDPCSGGEPGGDPEPAPWPWPNPDPAPPPDTGGGGDPGGGSPGDTNEGYPGYDKSKSLLSNTPCSNLITGNNPAGGASAMQVLQSATFITHSQAHPTYPSAMAIASVSPDGQRNVEFYPPYIFASGNTVYGLLEQGARLSRPLTPEEVQSVALLHEIAHHTGANNHPVGEAGTTFNLWILNQCLGVTVTFP